MPYPGSFYVLDLPALLSRVSHDCIIRFSLTSTFQASLLYCLNPPKCSPWKAFIKKHLGLTSYLTLLEKCYASQCAFKPHHPAPHWKVTIGDPTCLNNFRICLLVGCDRLEGDATRFSSRTTYTRTGNPSRKLCNQGVSGDAAYFVSTYMPCPQ